VTAPLQLRLRATRSISASEDAVESKNVIDGQGDRPGRNYGSVCRYHAVKTLGACAQSTPIWHSIHVPPTPARCCCRCNFIRLDDVTSRPTSARYWVAPTRCRSVCVCGQSDWSTVRALIYTAVMTSPQTRTRVRKGLR